MHSRQHDLCHPASLIFQLPDPKSRPPQCAPRSKYTKFGDRSFNVFFIYCVESRTRDSCPAVRESFIRFTKPTVETLNYSDHYHQHRHVSGERRIFVLSLRPFSPTYRTPCLSPFRINGGLRLSPQQTVAVICFYVHDCAAGTQLLYKNNSPTGPDTTSNFVG